MSAINAQVYSPMLHGSGYVEAHVVLYEAAKQMARWMFIGGKMNGFDVIIQPDAEDADAAEVLVDGALGGRRYRFLLDTGAARSCVRYDEYTATFARVGTDTSSGVFAGGSRELVMAPRLRVGPISRSDFTLVRAAQGETGRQNLLGMDLLKDLRCHFRFDERRVEVDEDGDDGDDDEDDGDAFAELFLDQRAHPYVPVRLGDVSANAVWDSGSGMTVVDTNFIARTPGFFPAAGQTIGADSTGAQQETALYVMAAATIGGYTFPTQRVAAVDLSRVNATLERPMDLIVGYNLYRQAHWRFDFPRRRWRITKMLT
jgi:Aspartyl protease